MAIQPVYISEEKRSELLSLCMARDSWTHALHALEQMIALGSHPDHVMYDVLLSAACVLYMRPFEKSHGLTRLTDYEKFDTYSDRTDLERIHAAVDKTRNQIMAHQQVSGWDKLLKGVPSALPAQRLIVRMGDGKGMSYEITAPTLTPEFVHPFIHLVKTQRARANGAFFQAVVPVLPSSWIGRGEFSLEVQAKGGSSPVNVAVGSGP